MQYEGLPRVPPRNRATAKNRWRGRKAQRRGLPEQIAGPEPAGLGRQWAGDVPGTRSALTRRPLDLSASAPGCAAIPVSAHHCGSHPPCWPSEVTATAVRGSDQRSPGGGTPDPIAGRRKAASKGLSALQLLVNRGAPVWLARLSRLPGQAGAARFDAGQIEQTPTAAQGGSKPFPSNPESP